MLTNEDYAILNAHCLAHLKSLYPQLEGCTISLQSDGHLQIFADNTEQIAAIKRITGKLKKNAWIVAGACKISIYLNACVMESFALFANVGYGPIVNVELRMTTTIQREQETAKVNSIDSAANAVISRLKNVPSNSAYPLAMIAKQWGIDEQELQQQLSRLEAPTMTEMVGGKQLITVASLMEAVEHGLLHPLLEQKAQELVSFVTPGSTPASATMPMPTAKPTSSRTRSRKAASTSKRSSAKASRKPSVESANGAATAESTSTLATLPTRLRPGFELGKTPTKTLNNLLTKLNVNNDTLLIKAVLTDLIDNSASVYRTRIKEKGGAAQLDRVVGSAKKMLKSINSTAASS